MRAESQSEERLKPTPFEIVRVIHMGADADAGADAAATATAVAGDASPSGKGEGTIVIAERRAATPPVGVALYAVLGEVICR